MGEGVSPSTTEMNGTDTDTHNHHKPSSVVGIDKNEGDTTNTIHNSADANGQRHDSKASNLVNQNESFLSVDVNSIATAVGAVDAGENASVRGPSDISVSANAANAVGKNDLQNAGGGNVHDNHNLNGHHGRQQHHQNQLENIDLDVQRKNELVANKDPKLNSEIMEMGVQVIAPMTTVDAERVNEVATTLSTSGSNSAQSRNSSTRSGISGIGFGMVEDTSILPQIPNLQQQGQSQQPQPQPQPHLYHKPQHLNEIDNANHLPPIFVNAPDPNNHQQNYTQLPTRQYSNENIQNINRASNATSPVSSDFNQQQPQQQQQQYHQLRNQSPTTSQTAPLQPQFTTTNPIPAASNIDELNDSPETNFDSILKSPKNKDIIVEKSPGERYLRFSEKLGSGAYKDVYRAYDTIEGIEVAWNAVTLTGVAKSQRQYIVNEVRLLEKLNHANIISFHGSWVNRELEQVIFVTEILSSGTLKSFIEKVQVIRWKIAKRWAKQILKGLQYLHSQDPPIVHRDLKCDNIFINGTSGDLRIGDLGLSTVINKGNEKKVLSVLGTPEFMAPELYNESYDQAVDIYAFGMCMLEIFTKEVPYRECTNPAQIYKKVTSGIEPESLNRIRSSNARDFIRLCLGTPDGQGGYFRPSATELLNHPFLAKREDDESEVKVDRPLREVEIPEGPAYAETVSQHHSQRDIPRQENQSDSDRSLPTNSTQGVLNTENRETLHQPNQININNSDEFNGMPDRESNIKNITVLMGRRQQNHENESENQHVASLSPPKPSTPPLQQQQQIPAPVVAQNHIQTSSQPLTNHVTQQQNPPASMTPSGGPPQNIVGQVVGNITDLGAFEKPGLPYENDLMHLRITLYVQNQEKQVQFDFHLINDDPVAVAHEMVRELHLPKEAVLELSERISSVARNARMVQDRYKKQTQRQQESHMNQVPVQEPNVGYQTAVVHQTFEMNNQGNQPNQYDVTEVNAEGIQGIPQEANPTVTSTTQPLQIHNHARTNSIAATIAAPNVPKHEDVKLQGNNLGDSIDELQQVNAMKINIDTDDDSTSNLSEIKQLKIDYKNKVTRANKAYQTRMENLIRSKEEKEALHLKTVEKHEKERLAFEKRVKQAEKEQQERVEKLTKEFEEQKAKALLSASEENINKEIDATISNRLQGGTKEDVLQAPSPTFAMDEKNSI